MNASTTLFDPRTTAYIMMWLANLIYLTGLIPQIYLNYKVKSTKGLNDFMLAAYVFAYFCHLYYVSCLDFPTSYRLLVPLGICTLLIVVGQRFYYDNHLIANGISHLYAGVAAIIIGVLPLAYLFPKTTGYTAGWMALTMWTIYMIPQIVQIYCTKSVKGFSFAFLTFGTVGIVLELASALILRGPSGRYLPLIFTSIRWLVVYAIFCVQFLLYKK